MEPDNKQEGKPKTTQNTPWISPSGKKMGRKISGHPGEQAQHEAAVYLCSKKG